MCIIKNKSNQTIKKDNLGKVAGRDNIEIYNDYSKNVTITQNFYNNDSNNVQNNKKYYSEEYKNYINSFKELEGYLYNSIFLKGNKEYKFSDDYLNFGKHILDWIMGKGSFPLDGYKKFCQTLINKYNIDKDDIILKRWEAFEKYFSSDITSSVSIYNDIFNDLKKIQLPSDLLDDILIDGRNISIEFNQLGNKITFRNKFQQEIEKHGRILAMPVYDRLKNEIYEKTLKENFNMETNSPNTIVFGSNLGLILNNIQNLIYNTLFFGSITHMKLCRKVISNVMYSYTKIYDDETFYKITLEMLILSGEYKEYKKLCLFLGDSFKFWYDQNFITNIISLTDRSLDYQKLSYKNFIYGFYGKYLSKEKYEELEACILNYLSDYKNINISLGHDIFRNIRENITITRQYSKIIEILDIYVSNGCRAYYDEISNILNNINIDKIESKLYKKYLKLVSKLIKVYKKDNLNYSITKILSKNPNEFTFSKYKNDPNILDLMEFNEKIKDNYAFLDEMIKNYQKRYEEKEQQPDTVKADNISYILNRKYYYEISKDKNILTLINDKYFPLIHNILVSENQTNEFKLEQLTNLLYMSSVDELSFLKEKILELVNNTHYGKGGESKFINCLDYKSISNDVIDLYVESIKSLLNVGMSLNEIIIICFENQSLEKVPLLDIANCIKTIGISNKKNEDILTKIYCFFIATYQKKYSNATELIEILEIFSNTQFEARVLQIMENISHDCTIEVAKELLIVIRNYDSNKTINILNNLKNNSNFAVRNMTIKYEKDCDI